MSWSAARCSGWDGCCPASEAPACSGADVTDELLRRSCSPLRAETFLGRDEVAAITGVQPIRVRPMLMHATPGIGPVVIDLTAKQVAADSPHVFVAAEAAQVLVADEHVVDVLHLEGEVVEARSRIPHAEEGVVVDVVVAG